MVLFPWRTSQCFLVAGRRQLWSKMGSVTEVITFLPPPGALRKASVVLLMRQETSFVGTTFTASPTRILLSISIYLCCIQGTLGGLNALILKLQGEAPQTGQIKPTYFTWQNLSLRRAAHYFLAYIWLINLSQYCSDAVR